jgi:hypothetical protein
MRGNRRFQRDMREKLRAELVQQPHPDRAATICPFSFGCSGFFCS